MKSGKSTYSVSMDKHQGSKKDPSARREQRKNHPRETRELTFFFLDEKSTGSRDRIDHRIDVTDRQINRSISGPGRWAAGVAGEAAEVAGEASRQRGGAPDPERRDRKSTRLNSSHSGESRMPSSA